jgi:hypothetical protein
MQNREAGGRFRRLASKLGGRETPRPTVAASSHGNQDQTSQVIKNDYNDRQRAQTRYKETADQLKEAIKSRSGLSSFDFEELTGEPEGFDDSQFKSKINAILTSREASIKDRKGWSKFTYAVECVFTAFSPFAKNFLTVAKNAQSVMTCLIVIFLISMYVDTRAESIWFDLRRSLSLNNGKLCSCDSDSRLRIKRLRGRQKL